MRNYPQEIMLLREVPSLGSKITFLENYFKLEKFNNNYFKPHTLDAFDVFIKS